MPASTLRSALYTFALNRDKLNSIYLIDLQKLSPETGPPKIEHYDEFSEIRNRFIATYKGDL